MFYQCLSLASITIPNTVTNLGDAAFTRCFALTNVVMGNRVSSIGDGTFNECTSLASITIPSSVTSIGSAAFMECTSLTSVTIPSSVTDIGSGAFGKCISLKGIIVNALNPNYSSVAGVLFDKSQTTLIQCPGGKAGAYVIPNGVTTIADEAFYWCTGLTRVTIPNRVTRIGDSAFYTCYSLSNVTIGNSVTSIGDYAFCQCQGLTSITIPNSVTSIGDDAFSYCVSLTSVIIPNSVTKIGDYAFYRCASLTGVYFQGNAPSLGGSYVFDPVYQKVTVYYLPGTTGWGTTFGGRPTALWAQVPAIQTPPQTQTAEAGSAVRFCVRASSPLPLFYFWYCNATNLLSSGTNWQVELPEAQFDHSGAYTAVITNAAGAITSSPAILQVIPSVEHRTALGVKVTGQTGSLWNVDYADSLSPEPNWTPLGSVSLTSTTGYCCDPTLPLPPQRFYRAWQTGTLGVMPSLDLHPVPAITLTGTIGHSVRLDYINQYGPIDAWVTLATVPLTNTSQLYFDISAPGQPQRLYRLVPSP